MLYNELLMMIKRKTFVMLILVLIVGTIMMAWIAIDQGGRMYHTGKIIQGKEAIALLDQESKAIQGDMDNETINELTKSLYQVKQADEFSMDDQINYLNSKEMIKYAPYTNFLLKLWNDPTQSYTFAYEQLYEAGKQNINVYDVWKDKVNQLYGLEGHDGVTISKLHYEAGSAGRIMISKLQDLMLLFMIIIVILCSTIFAKDRMTKTDQVILTTKYGIKALAKTRCLSAIVMMSVLFVFTISLYSLFIIAQLGPTGFSTSIQLSISALAPYECTILEAYAAMLLFAYVMNVIVMYLSLYFSSKTKKAYVVVLFGFLLLFIAYMLIQTTAEVNSSYLFMFLPFGLLEPRLLFSYHTIMLGSVSLWLPFLVCMMMILIAQLIRWRILVGSEHYASGI